MTYLYLRHSKGQAMSQEHITLLSEQHPDRVFIETDASPDALTPMLEQLESGDCVVAERIADLADNSRAFLELFAALSARGADLYCVREGLDTRGEAGAAAKALLAAVSALDTPDRQAAQRAGIERAREAGKYTGRRPIAVDDNAFSAVVARWRSGEITAKEAMQELGLKPNTFYRRIKAKGAEAMKSTEEFRAAAGQVAREIKAGIGAGADEIKEAAGRVVADVREGKVGEKVKEAAETVVTAAKEVKVGEKVKEAAETVVTAAKEAKVGEKVKEAAETVVTAAKEAKIGEKVKEAAETVVAAVKDGKVGEKVKEAAETVITAVKDGKAGEEPADGEPEAPAADEPRDDEE